MGLPRAPIMRHNIRKLDDTIGDISHTASQWIEARSPSFTFETTIESSMRCSVHLMNYLSKGCNDKKKHKFRLIPMNFVCFIENQAIENDPLVFPDN